jgi:hypothetical protein
MKQKGKIILSDMEAIISDFRDTIGYLEPAPTSNLASIKENCKTAETILHRLKAIVANEQFPSPDEEIRFFKSIKPSVLSQLMLHQDLYHLELRRPLGGIDIEQPFIKKEILAINGYNHAHFDLYQYFRTGATHFDQRYFVRGQILEPNTPFLPITEIDNTFSTAYDILFSRFIANDLLIHYLERLLSPANAEHTSNTQDSGPGLTWVGPVVGLWEIIIAAHASGAFGTTTLNKVAIGISRMLHVKAPNISKIKEDISLRKNPSIYLDQYRAALLSLVDQVNEKKL